MKEIFEEIPNPNAQNSNGQSPLHIASEKGKFNQNVQRDFSNNVKIILCVWIETGHVNVIELLFKNGADINLRNSQELTPLFVAVQNGILQN